MSKLEFSEHLFRIFNVKSNHVSGDASPNRIWKVICIKLFKFCRTYCLVVILNFDSDFHYKRKDEQPTEYVFDLFSITFFFFFLQLIYSLYNLLLSTSYSHECPCCLHELQWKESFSSHFWFGWNSSRYRFGIGCSASYNLIPFWYS